VANRAVRERLAQDVSGWLADGLIPKATHDLLRQRYGASDFGLAQAIKSFGVAGGIIAFFGLLGMVAAISGSRLVTGFLLLAAGAALTAAGIRLSIDKLGRFAASSRAVLMLGVVTAALGIGALVSGVGIKDQAAVFLIGILVLGPVGILAYRFGNTSLLVLGLIGFFHWIGTWTSMMGRSTYEIYIEDPRVMSLFALGAVVVGIYHEQNLRAQTGRFYQAYQTLGLIYLNLSLLILTIDFRTGWGSASGWIAVLAAAAIGQIVAGARLPNPLLTGFGVTSFALNIYTRYYETFWNHMHTGVFFLLGGLSLFAAGMACEIVLRRSQQRAA
jgi:hypothetical protein